jgi:hypothetical protein
MLRCRGFVRRARLVCGRFDLGLLGPHRLDADRFGSGSVDSGRFWSFGPGMVRCFVAWGCGSAPVARGSRVARRRP